MSRSRSRASITVIATISCRSIPGWGKSNHTQCGSTAMMQGRKQANQYETAIFRTSAESISSILLTANLAQFITLTRSAWGPNLVQIAVYWTSLRRGEMSHTCAFLPPFPYNAQCGYILRQLRQTFALQRFVEHEAKKGQTMECHLVLHFVAWKKVLPETTFTQNGCR
jgi:hypothetical protein